MIAFVLSPDALRPYHEGCAASQTSGIISMRVVFGAGHSTVFSAPDPECHCTGDAPRRMSGVRYCFRLPSPLLVWRGFTVGMPLVRAGLDHRSG
jgi:hypothetical protein